MNKLKLFLEFMSTVVDSSLFSLTLLFTLNSTENSLLDT